MFGHSTATLVHLKRNELLIYADAAKPALLPIPEDIVHYLEVQDAHRWAELLAQFIQGQQLRGRRIAVLLDEDLLFLSAQSLQGVDVNAQVNDFANKLPFDPPNRQFIQLTTKDRLLLCGTNKAIYGPLVTALQAAGNKILAVMPAPMYGVKAGGNLSPDKVSQLLSGFGHIRRANFLTASMPEM